MHAIDNAQAAKPILFIMSARVTGQRPEMQVNLIFNDRQLVEQEISGKYEGSVEVMYSVRP